MEDLTAEFDAASISDTVKRSGPSRVDLTRSDLIRLLSYLEGELQARDVAIATLKCEKAKQLLYQAKYGRLGANDPFAALQRDSDHANETFDERATARMYESQLSQLEKLIAVQKRAHIRAKQVLGAAERRHLKTVRELEGEREESVADAAEGDDVCMMLEKERDKLKHQIEHQNAEQEKSKEELNKLKQTLECEKERHKAIVLYLLNERKELQWKLMEERKKICALKATLPTQTDDELNKLKCICTDQHDRLLKMESDKLRLVKEKALLKTDLEAQHQETASLREIVRTQDEDLNLIRRNILAKTQQYAQRQLQAQQHFIESSLDDFDLPTSSGFTPSGERPPQPPAYHHRLSKGVVSSTHPVLTTNTQSLLQKKNSNPESSYMPSSPRPSVRVLTNPNYVPKNDREHASSGPARFPQVLTSADIPLASSSLPTISRVGSSSSRPTTLPSSNRRSSSNANVPPPPPPAYASPVSSAPSSSIASPVVQPVRPRPAKQNSTGSSNNERRTQESSSSSSDNGDPNCPSRAYNPNGAFGLNGEGRLPRLSKRAPTPAPQYVNGDGTIRRRMQTSIASFSSALPSSTNKLAKGKLKKATQV